MLHVSGWEGGQSGIEPGLWSTVLNAAENVGYRMMSVAFPPECTGARPEAAGLALIM